MRPLLAIAALLVSSLAAAKPIEDFHQVADGTDYVPAFERAQAACAAAGGNTSYATYPGCRIDLGPAVYKLSRAVQVLVPIQVVGQGIGSQLAASRLEVNRTSVFIGTMKWSGIALEHVTIVNMAKGSLDGDPPTYAVSSAGRISLRDVGIRGPFTVGVKLACATPLQNCSASFIEDSDIDQVEWAGIYTQGPDSSASAAVRVRSAANCRNAAKWAKSELAPFCGDAKNANSVVCTQAHYSCAGIMDLGYLGNTWIATQVATMSGFAGIVMAGANQHSTTLGGYHEIDTDPSWVDVRSNVFGGGSVFGGAGGQFHGMATTGLSITLPGYTFQLGMATNVGNAVWSIGNTATGPWPWRFKLDPSGAMVWDIGNSRVVGAAPWARP